ncbi:hypothetical protein [Corynebacterium lowii]|uniref:hypothetical protein n=1 Tax=Corynebacterium lowii TaxID=1544413 RepID=UPI0012E256FA|nr:hypothetical protein [Corynebacterium lowii]MDP9852481.1 hypothetical protein [Corynebacterium lowii]
MISPLLSRFWGIYDRGCAFLQGFKIPRWMYAVVFLILVLFCGSLFLFEIGVLADRIKMVISILTVSSALLAFGQKVLSDDRSEWWNRFEWVVEQENGKEPDWVMLARTYRGLLEERRWPRRDAPMKISVLDHRARCVLEFYAQNGRLEQAKKKLSGHGGQTMSRLNEIVQRFGIEDQPVLVVRGSGVSVRSEMAMIKGGC